MKRAELAKIRKNWFYVNWEYELTDWKSFDYSILDKILFYKQRGAGSNKAFNECIIMADTETSKKQKDGIHENHVVAWTITIRAFDTNICTLYGHKPSTHVECMKKIHDSMHGEKTLVYYHNLSYDWIFTRAFMIKAWGAPVKQLNTKPHYPIEIQFENGITLKDSLILAQRNLEKWGEDLGVEHQKAVGSWDYDALRDQDHDFTQSELEYIEHDTLCGAECIDATLKSLNKNVCHAPYTATGIPREDIRKIGKLNHSRDWFLRQHLDYEQVAKAEAIYHGGYTHQNRHLADVVVDKVHTIGRNIKCKDFASSYPYCILVGLFPAEKFTPMNNEGCAPEHILKYKDKRAFMFSFHAKNIRLKNPLFPMPALQYSKCTYTLNDVQDNGRILSAAYIEIPLNEVDLAVIASMYIWDDAWCHDVETAYKDYLPRWITDYVYHLFEEKTKLKGQGVLYSIAKSRINSVYGMFCQHTIRQMIIEDYSSGEYYIDDSTDPTEIYEKYLKSRNSILPYQIGCWITSYAFYNIFQLGSCISDEGAWIYTDTDSCYAYGWDEGKVKAYNDNCKKLLIDRGYGAVLHNGREYWLGVAEDDGEYTEFKGIHSKCYCCRNTDGKLKITVAGVPKKGVECLNDDINNFKPGFVFSGTRTGKKTHTYFYNDIYIDERGNETGDSIDLSPCDYLVNNVNLTNKEAWEQLFRDNIEVEYYEE